MKPNGHFVMKGAVLTVIEDSSFYDSHIGSAETNVYDLVFDSGEKLKVKNNFTVNLEQIDVKGEDDEGRITLAPVAHGIIRTFGEDQEALFECEWQMKEEPRVVLYNNLIAELMLPIVYSGEGTNSYAEHLISGQIIVERTGLDESGMDVYELRGDGIIQ